MGEKFLLHTPIFTPVWGSYTVHCDTMTKKIYPYEKNGRFYVDQHHKTESLLFGTVPSFIRSLVHKLFRKEDARSIASWLEREKPLERSMHPVITWIGHATFLIQANGVNILTDPLFGSPSLLYPRLLPPGIPFDSLPHIDGVLISHNHRDHMDESTIMALYKKNPDITFFVPFGDRRWFVRRGIMRVQEFIWEQAGVLSNREGDADVSCTFVPAHHWSARGLFDTNKSLWGGWMIQMNGSTIYFAGDTAYDARLFSRIAHLFPIIDVAMMPISPQEPHDWMKHTHMNAAQAGEAVMVTGAQRCIPMHWGTFSLGVDSFNSPIDSMRTWWQQNQSRLGDKELIAMKVGQRFLVPGRLIEQSADYGHVSMR